MPKAVLLALAAAAQQPSVVGDHPEIVQRLRARMDGFRMRIDAGRP